MAIQTFYDQLGNELVVDFPPRRIISLVPSQTELLHDLGLNEEVVGITKFCVHPSSWHSSKPKIGGTKTFLFDQIDALHPDLIIGNKEENYQEGIEALQARYPVWMSDIKNLDEALTMIRSVGELVGRKEKAEALANRITMQFRSLRPHPPRKVLYLIWRKPWMAAGPDTFIHAMLEKLGFVNCLSQPRYPELTPEQIRELNPELILLSSEPFPFKEKHIAEIQSLAPKAKVQLVDGEFFSWYGSRLALAPDYFSSLRF